MGSTRAKNPAPTLVSNRVQDGGSLVLERICTKPHPLDDPPAERSTANRHPSDGALVVPVSGLNKSLHSWSERLGGVGPSKQLRNTPGTPHRTTHPSEPISQLGWAGLASRSPVWASCLSRSALIDSPSSVLQNAVSTARSCDAFLKGGGKQFASPHRQARLVLRPDACFPVFLHTSSV